MIPYEELCAALERFRSNEPTDATGQTVMPPVGNQDDSTSVGVQAIYDDKSNELDIADVLSDEEAPKTSSMEPAEVEVRVAGRALGVEPAAEIAGEVVAAGEAAAEWLGKNVVVPRLLPCGDCDRCRRGRTAGCPGRVRRASMGSHERVPARFLLALEGPLWPFPADDVWQAAALTDAAAAPFAALARAGLAPGDLVAVIGDGPRAVLAAAIVKAKGGRAETVDPFQPPAPSPAEIVLETTGSAAGRHRALAMLGEGSTAVFLDGPGARVAVPPPEWDAFCAGERRLLGAEAAHPDFLPEVCALHARGELPLGELLLPIGPDDIDATLAERRAGRVHKLPVVRYPR